MSETIAEMLKTSVRPLVTLGLVGAFIVACFVNTEAADKLSDLTLAAFAFWFGGRNGKSETNDK